MHLLCPHCKNPIELVKIDPRAEITCTACGSSFRIDDGSTTGWTPPVGQSIGRFTVVETIGHGGFGIVFKARDPELDRTVAVKVPRRGNIGEAPQDVDRFLREARSVAQLRHPSIVSIHEVGTLDGTPYLVSDYVEGFTLADVLTARRLPPREAATLIAQIADAIDHAHQQGIVHRDVKPSNIMVRPDGLPVVMDFGLAKREAGEITVTVDGQVLGTPAYMSPEQARGEAHRVDGRSDIYSLGVILYQMLAGQLPFRGVARMLLHQVLHDEPQPPRAFDRHIPHDLQTICLTAMAKEPSRRYQTAGAFAADLRRFLANEPIKARPVSVVERTVKWVRRRPAVTAAAAVGALVAGIFVVGYLWQREQAWEKEQALLEARRQEEERAREEEASRQVRLEYYATIVKRHGLPEGIGRLSEDQARRRSLVHRLTLRGGKVQVLEVVNGRGQYTTPDRTGNIHTSRLDSLGGTSREGTACRFEYHRDADGRLTRELAFDRLGEMLWTFHFTSPTVGHFTDARGFPREPSGSGATYVEFTWSTEGFEIERHYLNRSGERSPDAEGVYGLRRRVDERGLPLQETFLGRHDEPVLGKNGYAHHLAVHNAEGNSTEWTFLGLDGQLALRRDERWARATKRYDDNGNWIEWQCFGRDGKPTMTPNGHSRVTQGYDEYGNVNERKMYGVDGKPATSTLYGAATVRTAHDDRGNPTEVSYFDRAGEPTRGRMGAFKAISTYDERNNVTSRSHQDVSGRPIATTTGSGKIAYDYDRRGNNTEIRLLSPDGKGPLRPTGISVVRMAYNDQRNRTETTYFDHEGRAAAQGLVHCVKEEHDDRGNVTRRSYRGLDGKLVIGPGGFAASTSQYDDRGYRVEIAFTGTDGQPCESTAGFAKSTTIRDEYGRSLGESLFGVVGKPAVNKAGFHRSTRKYDEWDNETAFAGFGIDGKPTLGVDGYASFARTFDDRRNPIEDAYFGLDGKPTLNTRLGCARVVRTYDTLKRPTDVHYLDMEGKRVPTRLFVREVPPDSAEAKAGLQVGDIVVRYGGREVANSVQFARAEEDALQRGEPIEAVLIRGEKTLTVTIEAPFSAPWLEDRAATPSKSKQ